MIEPITGFSGKHVTPKKTKPVKREESMEKAVTESKINLDKSPAAVMGRTLVPAPDGKLDLKEPEMDSAVKAIVREEYNYAVQNGEDPTVAAEEAYRQATCLNSVKNV